MDSAIAGLIGGAIGAATGLIGSLSTSWLSLKKEREQSLRNKEVEQEKWVRERSQEAYSNCIDYLSRISRASEISIESGQPSVILAKEHQRELFSDYSESQKWLGMLLIYYPHKEEDPMRGGYSTLCQEIMEFSSGQVPNFDLAKQLREKIIDLASTDVRLQGRQSLIANGR
jgi:gas vesicle protein